MSTVSSLARSRLLTPTKGRTRSITSCKAEDRYASIKRPGTSAPEASPSPLRVRSTAYGTLDLTGSLCWSLWLPNPNRGEAGMDETKAVTPANAAFYPAFETLDIKEKE